MNHKLDIVCVISSNNKSKNCLFRVHKNFSDGCYRAVKLVASKIYSDFNN